MTQSTTLKKEQDTEPAAWGEHRARHRRERFRIKRTTDAETADPEVPKKLTRRQRKKAKANELARAWEDVPQFQPQGALLRQKARTARRGGYAPLAEGAPGTTRQGEVLNPAILAAPTDAEGIAVGRDLLTNSMVNHDPFTAYSKKQITSPAVIVLGIIGSGKSSLLKTVYVLRPLTFIGRRCVVIDRKDQEGAGEYTDTTRRFGGEPYRMLIGNRAEGTVLNVLDPEIRDILGTSGQRRLLRAMIERSADGRLMDKWERKALRVAHQRVLRSSEQDGEVPVLDHLVPLLGNMDDGAAYRGLSAQAKERLHQAGVGLRFLLEEAMDEELDGLFNGHTSRHVNLESKLTTFDISQLPEEGPAAGMVMAVAQAWTMGRLRRERGWATNFVVEEGWDMVSGPIGRALKSQQLLARGLGLSIVTAMHHIRQVSHDSHARELLQEPQTIHLYRQEREEDVQACITNFGLNGQSADTLRNMPAGRHLLKIGNAPEIAVEHVRSEWEADLTNTDNAMLIGAR